MMNYLKKDPANIFEFLGFLFSIIGSFLVANKIEYGWFLYMFANTSFIIFALNKRMAFITVLNVWFIITNLIAIYNYFIK
jgi:hypothetical protein